MQIGSKEKSYGKASWNTTHTCYSVSPHREGGGVFQAVVSCVGSKASVLSCSVCEREEEEEEERPGRKKKQLHLCFMAASMFNSALSYFVPFF